MASVAPTRTSASSFRGELTDGVALPCNVPGTGPDLTAGDHQAGPGGHSPVEPPERPEDRWLRTSRGWGRRGGSARHRVEARWRPTTIVGVL